MCASSVKFDARLYSQGEASNDDIRNISFSIKEIKVTNQVCELLACIKGLETIITTQNIGKNLFKKYFIS